MSFTIICDKCGKEEFIEVEALMDQYSDSYVEISCLSCGNKEEYE